MNHLTLLRTLSTGVSMTPVMIDSVRSLSPCGGGRMSGSPGRPAATGQTSPVTPALSSSEYLLAALAPLMLPRPRSVAGWPATGCRGAPGRGERRPGTQFLMGYYRLLDRVPKGRDEGDAWQTWIRCHNEC